MESTKSFPKMQEYIFNEKAQKWDDAITQVFWGLKNWGPKIYETTKLGQSPPFTFQVISNSAVAPM